MNPFSIGAVIEAVMAFVGSVGTFLRYAGYVYMGVSSYQNYKAGKALQRASQEILLTKYGTGGGIPVVYGTRRVGGTVVFMETVNNKELFVVYALAVGEVEDIGDLRIDNRSIDDTSIFRQGYTLRKEGNYFGSSSPPSIDIGNVLGGAGGDNPRMVFNIHHGADDQAADPMLLNVFDGSTSSRPNLWTSDHRLRGIAYIAANYEFDEQGMFTGIPNLSARVKGKKVLDTRTSTTAWSDNPALCLHDYLTNDEYGKGLPTSAINTSSFNTAANDCEVDEQTINHGSSVVIRSASTSNDLVYLDNVTTYNNIKLGASISFSSGGTTYFSGQVIDKYSQIEQELGQTYARVLRLTLAEGSVTTAITSNTTGTLTETQPKFHCNAVVDTGETVLDNTKRLVNNMRGIFTYTNGQYAIDVEGTETPILTLDEDDILESGIELGLENRENKYNKVEVTFYNGAKNYEADTVIVTDGLSYDNNEVLETRAEFPYVTNQRIAYNHANAILKRSRNNRTISFVATPKVLQAKVGEVIAVTNSNLGLSAEQYRITNMEISPDLTVAVQGVEYLGDVYGWNDPPDEEIGVQVTPPDPYRVEQVTNLNFVQKSGSTPAYLSWTDADAYASFEFSVKVYDAINQGGNIIRDGRVKETRFYLPELPKANGYSAEVISINTLGIESDPTPLNSFDVTVDPVINDDIGGGAVDTPEIAQGAIGGMNFTTTKAYYGTGTFNNSNTPFYVDTSSNFSLGSALSFNGTTLTIGGYASDADISDFITGAEVNANVTNISGGAIQTGTVAAARIDVSGVITAGSIIVGGDNISNLTNDSGFTDFDATDVESAIANNVTVISGSKITTGTINASLVSVTNLTADNITAGTLNVDRLSIDGTTITAVAGELLVGIIDQDNISVTNLAAISADLGSITAGSINIGSGAFTVSSSGVLTATGATVSGNITASSINLDTATVTGTLDVARLSIDGTTITSVGGNLVVGIIDQSNISVSTLSAITADLGSITAGSINIGSGAFTVSSSGVMTATGATVSGNVTASSIDLSTATVTGTLDSARINADTLNVKHFDNVSTDIKSHTGAFVPLQVFGSTFERASTDFTTQTTTTGTYLSMSIGDVRNGAKYQAIWTGVYGDCTSGYLEYSVDNSTWVQAAGGIQNVTFAAGTFRTYVFAYSGTISGLGSTADTVYWRVRWITKLRSTYQSLYVFIDNTQ
jgi:hypothetical protein